MESNKKNTDRLKEKWAKNMICHFMKKKSNVHHIKNFNFLFLKIQMKVTMEYNFLLIRLMKIKIVICSGVEINTLRQALSYHTGGIIDWPLENNLVYFSRVFKIFNFIERAITFPRFYSYGTILIWCTLRWCKICTP